MNSKSSILSLLALVFLACAEDNLPDTKGMALPRVVDYNFHIRPILADRCFKCHGPDANQRKAELRLDDSKRALGKTKLSTSQAKYVLHPGSTRRSELFKRMRSHDPDYVMPPPESNLNVSGYELALIEKWIEQGAEYKKHWSLLPISPPRPMRHSGDLWSRNQIDQLILAAMKSNGLEPGDEAAKEELIRRLSLDMTGLPPSPDELEVFLNDQSQNAYEALVDRLLDSKHFGEHLALQWLDVARYADSHGYQDDGLRNTWPYRDWLIDAFNQNMPYDQFIIEQLAGDLLPDPTTQQLIATCFNRNHPQTQEGGVVDEEYRVEYVADRVNTLGKGLLGLTFECARCHDHKYDPITQKEYYGLFAYFNNNNDTGIVPYNGEASPTVLLPTPEQQDLLKNIQSNIQELEDSLVSEIYISDFEDWLSLGEPIIQETEGLAAGFHFDRVVHVQTGSLNLDNNPNFKEPSKTNKKMEDSYLDFSKNVPGATVSGGGDVPELVEGKFGKAIRMKGDAGLRFSRDLDFDRHQPFSVSIWVKLEKRGEAGPLFNKTNGDFEGYRGWLCKLNADGTLSFQFNHVWPDNSIDFQTTDTLPVNQWNHIVLTYDGSSKASGVKFFLNGQIPGYRLHKDNLHKSLLHGVEGSNWSNLPFMVGVELRKSIQHAVFDELHVYNRQLSTIEAERLFYGQANHKASDTELLEYYLLSGINDRYNKNLEKLTSLRDEENRLMTDFREVMIMQEKTFSRATYILDRGAYDAPLEKVNPTIPQALLASDNRPFEDRLDLAEWIVSGDNTLTARVQANRFWMMLFGKGLVATQEDFGSQGDLPSHPDLLDHLASELIISGWNLKGLIKYIVMSATYRLSSRPTKESYHLDPLNQWYSSYPAHRIPAESIRDAALKAAGLLSDSIGGPSVYPYQPDGLWEALATRNATRYQTGQGEDLYRRSLYTIWKRSSPPPSMMHFDSPDRYSCTVRRQQTSTPLQALVIMNDPQYIESARVLAQNILTAEEHSAEVVIERIFIRLLGRRPSSLETKAMAALYQVQLDRFNANREQALDLIKVGEYPVNDDIADDQLAAFTLVASTIMNLDDFIMKR